MKKAIILFVKHPAPGRVKTRLAAELGAERAVEIYRELVEAVCSLLPNESIFVACEPAAEIPAIRAWLQRFLPEAEFLAQQDGDLGSRLTHAFAEIFSRGYDRVAVIGSDCVELEAAIFEQAFDALSECDCAIGPALDGGYYLLALRTSAPALFLEVPWSSPETCARTIARAGEIGLTVQELPTLGDVDTAADWRRVQTILQPRIEVPAA